MSYEFGYRPRMGSGLAVLAIGALSAFGFFDGIRSVGQNTNAKSLGGNIRVVFTGDFNPWEQTKDYFAPQAPHTEGALSRNDDRAPLFDGSRDWDAGHIAIPVLLGLIGVAVKNTD